ELAGVNTTYEGLRDLIVREQFLGTVSIEMEIFLRERSEKDLKKMTKQAEHYMNAHGIRGVGGKVNSEIKMKNRQEKQNDKRRIKPEADGNKFKERRRCLKCGVRGHILKYCKKSIRTNTGTMEANKPRLELDKKVKDREAQA